VVARLTGVASGQIVADREAWLARLARLREETATGRPRRRPRKFSTSFAPNEAKMGYWDTSTLVKLYAKEPDSALFEAQAMATSSVAVPSRLPFTKPEPRSNARKRKVFLQSGAAQKLYSRTATGRCHGGNAVGGVGGMWNRNMAKCSPFATRRTPGFSAHARRTAPGFGARGGRKPDLVATDKRMRDAAKALGFSLFPA